MKLDFSLNTVATTEFGVGRDDGHQQAFRLVPVDGDVQVALREMAAATRTAMDAMSDGPSKYEPSERYESCEYVFLPLDDELAQQLRSLHEAKNIPPETASLEDSSDIFCYFARITDKHGRRLTALRRATQFKGVLKSRLIRLATDALRMIEDKVFKLDNDFDLLIDGSNVHILRPSGFEFVGKLQDAVLAAAPANVKAIQHDLPFVNFTAVEQYVSKHARAARYLASIRSQKAAKNIDKGALRELCKATGVVIREEKGKIVVDEHQVMGFLEVLDRRRYEVELVKDSPERFRAPSRRKL